MFSFPPTKAIKDSINEYALSSFSIYWVCIKWTILGLLRWLTGKESACQCRRLRFDPRIRKILWHRKRQPTLVFLAEKFHGQRSLVGYSPCSYKESDTTEHPHINCIRCFRDIQRWSQHILWTSQVKSMIQVRCSVFSKWCAKEGL